MIHYLVLQHVYSRVNEFISMLCTIMHWSRNLKILLGHPFSQYQQILNGHISVFYSGELIVASFSNTEVVVELQAHSTE